MQPLVEPSRERRVDPLQTTRDSVASSSSSTSLATPPVAEEADIGFDPYALEALPAGFDELPGLELEPLVRPVPPPIAPATVAEVVAPSSRRDRTVAFARAHPRIVGLVLLALVAVIGRCDRSERWPVGAKITREPTQEPIEEARVTAFEGYELIPRATYRVRARILGRERYRVGREADLSSYDLALGWGVMSDQRVIDGLEIRQGSRRYRYTWSGDEPAHPSAMARQSANHHIIAGSPDVNEVLEDTPVGGALELEGDLVVVEAPDGWRWQTSLSRLDVGDGACEIFHVKRARRLTREEAAQ